MKSQVERWLLILSLAACLSSFTSVSCEDDSRESNAPKRVPLVALPDPYSDSKLPRGLSDSANMCLPLLGCIETLPNTGSPQDPLSLGTEFSIYGENSSVVVDYKPVINCLVNHKQCDIYPYDLKALMDSSFNPNNPTIVVTPGYLTKDLASWQQEIRNLWKKWANVNVILVRWPGGNSGLYPQAVANTKVVARQITVLFYYLAKLNNLRLSNREFLDKIYLVGHSLGAHISGFVGKDLNGEVGRITGLDPAGPSFVDVKQRHRLDRGDAQLVEAIHTNGGQVSLTQHQFGMLEPIGHIDYYANDGKHQPGCSMGKDLIGCSHNMAPPYYISLLEHQLNSLNHFGNGDRLSAFRADSFEDFDSGSSLLKRCPQSALGKKLALDDLNKCTLPMDFFASPGEHRRLLREDYQIDLNQQQLNSSILAYFYTITEEPYVGHHGLLRADARNLTNDISANGCNLRLNLKLADGQSTEREVKGYKVVSNKIVLPYLLFSRQHPNELEKLDSNDFFLNKTDISKAQQILGIQRALIKTIEVSGLRSSLSGSGSQVLNGFRELFAMAGNQDPTTSVQCDFLIDTISTQPLKRMRKSMLAWYSALAYSKDIPDVVSLKGSEKLPDANAINLSTEFRQTNPNSGPEVYIDAVYIS